MTSPVLAWGFLGPGGPFKQLCLYFKVGDLLGSFWDFFGFYCSLLDFLRVLFEISEVCLEGVGDICSLEYLGGQQKLGRC